MTTGHDGMAARALTPDAASSDLIGRAAAAEQAGRRVEALALCREAAALAPASATIELRTATVLAGLGRFEDAIEAATRAISLDVTQPGPFILLGQISQHLGQHEAAAEWCRRAIQVQPNDVDAYAALYEALAAAGRHDEAMAVLTACVDLFPDTANAHFNLGVGHHRGERADAAIAAYSRAIDLDPLHGPAMLHLAALLTDLGRHAEAVALCRQAANLRPADGNAHVSLSKALAGQGQWAEAWAAARQAAALDRNSPEPYLQMAEIASRAGQTGKAAQLREAAETIRWRRANAGPIASRTTAIINALRAVPVIVYNVEVTSACNLKCIMCPMKSMTRPHSHMPVERFRRAVAEGVAAGAEKFDFHIAGEPLLHPNIVELVSIARQAGFPHLQLTTNGTLLTINMAKALIAAGASHFFITIDGGNAENYRRIRGGKFEKVTRNLGDLIEHIRSSAPQVSLSIRCIKFPELLEDIDAFVAEWRERTRDLPTVSVERKPLDHMGPTNTSASLTDLERSPGEPRDNPALDSYRGRRALPELTDLCPYLQANWINVHVSGNVTPCCYDMDEHISLGNIETSSLRQTLDGPQLDAMRRAFLDRDFKALPRFCHSCPTVVSRL